MKTRGEDIYFSCKPKGEASEISLVNTLISHLASKTVSKYISFGEVFLVCGPLLCQPQQNNTMHQLKGLQP